jgi:hypothetical protein
MFKFVSDLGCLPTIAAGTLKFARPADMNDPAEILPYIDQSEFTRSLEHYRLNGLSEDDYRELQRQQLLLEKLARDAIGSEVPNTRAQAFEVLRARLDQDVWILERYLREVASLIAQSIGVLCLTKHVHSLPMWAHYAGRASGATVELCDLDKAFPADDTGILGQPIDVTYPQRRTGVTFDPRSHRSLFFDKFKDWDYEQEVRVILPLSCCRQSVEAQQSSFFFDTQPKHVRRIILGWNVSPDQEVRVRQQVLAINNDVIIAKASCERGQVVVRDV